MSTLLEKALNAPAGAKKTAWVPEELAEMSIAWAQGHLATKQVSEACGVEFQGSVYNNLAQGLRHAIRLGLLVPKEVKP